MMNCCCPFRDALIERVFQDRTTLKSPSLSVLIADAEVCCDLTLILYLAFCCKDVPAFIAEMRGILQNVYGLHLED